ncbi:MAG TPA: class I SAM-dependent rRNA methyltransferase [Gemmatimonadales bacterium]|nr:class I SAM-dependent rRNA methyltransferase [Gemmatimonadales bacterium]
MTPTVVVAPRGAARWQAGHPWIYRSDVAPARVPAGIVHVADPAHRFLGQALYSPASEIRLRMLTRDAQPITPDWWTATIAAALARRRDISTQATAYRVVHGEGDGLPSLVVDRYGDYVVAQLLSAGLEARRPDILSALATVLAPRGILLRHDASVRRHERLPLEIVEAAGGVPEDIDVTEHGVRFVVQPRAGQKTGAFLDQRDNRARVRALASGRALDVFTYQGLFALSLAVGARSVVAVDSSAPALDAARRNARVNGITGIDWREGNAFDFLRAAERARERYDTIVLDPPAFARTRAAVPKALAGYKEINLRAIRLLAPGGVLFTCSCSYHVSRASFLEMLAAAAGDSGRRVVLDSVTGQPADHPELLTVPETGYLKGVFLRAQD